MTSRLQFTPPALWLLAACVGSGEPKPTPEDSADTADSDAPSDADGDGYDSEDDCDDSDAAVYPGAEEICGDGQINDCDGDGSGQCELPAELALADATLKLTGAQSGESAGYSVAAIGDIEGDGWGDLLVGAIRHEGAGENSGAAYLVKGAIALGGASPASLDSTGLTLLGEQADDVAGAAVAGPGDVDGDGYDDLLVGAPYNQDGSYNGGAVYLVYGTTAMTTEATLSLGEADLQLYGDSDISGATLADAGDIDGDGLPELLIGNPESRAGRTTNGAAVVVFGLTASGATADFDLTQADLTLAGEDYDDQAGASVAGNGDVDGDGLADLWIGAQETDVSGSDDGAAYLALSGSIASLFGVSSLRDADLKVTGAAADTATGAGVAIVEDVDGDGLDELLVGAPWADGTAASAGMVCMFLGSSLPGLGEETTLDTADLTIYGDARGEEVGYELDSAGDVDADGLGDALIGAENSSPSGEESGAAYLVTGATLRVGGTMKLHDVDMSLAGEAAEDRAGASVAGAGDVDADGHADLFIGAWGESSAGAAYLVAGQGY